MRTNNAADIAKALAELNVQIQIDENGETIAVFPRNEGTMALPVRNEATIDIVLALLRDKFSELPSEAGIRLALRALRGVAILSTARVPQLANSQLNPCVERILQFMDEKNVWTGKLSNLLEVAFTSMRNAGVDLPTTHSLSVTISQQTDTFRQQGLRVQKFRRSTGSHIRLSWFETSDGGDADEGGDSGEGLITTVDNREEGEMRNRIKRIQEAGILANLEETTP